MTDSFCVIYTPAALDDLRAIFSYIAFDLKAEQAATNQTNRIRKRWGRGLAEWCAIFCPQIPKCHTI